MVEQEVIDCMDDIIKKLEVREAARIRQIKYRAKESTKEKKRQWHIDNKERRNKQDKIWRQTENGKKSKRISQWKKQGIICDNWDALYDHYLKTSFCDFCKVKLTYDKKSSSAMKVVDHDHSITDRPNFRNILCNCCNIKRK